MIGIKRGAGAMAQARKSVQALFVWAFALSIAGAPPANADELAYALEIPAQDLDGALKTLAVETDKQVLFAASDVKGHTSPEINGEYNTFDAMALLLADTGLVYEVTRSDVLLVKPNDETVGIGQASDQGGDSDLKNLSAGPTSVLMAQNQTSTIPATSNGRSEEDGTSVVTGTVTDARTGANLKGAKVTIEETGQWTSTGDLGRFRFANVPQGRVTLTVSNLGYAMQSTIVSVGRGGVTFDFALRGGSEIEEIVVFGQRSARAVALNQQRTAQINSTVITADHLGQFSSTNLPDALRRAPGVTFVQDPTTGQSSDVTVRGLTRDLNSVQLNGISVPGDGPTRFADISNILTDSIESVTISKSLLPSQETNGTGGLIEIETKTPLDRPDSFYQVGYERAEGIDDTVSTNYYSATVSKKFLESKNLGFSVSGQYADDELTGASFRGTPVFGSYLPAGISNTNQIDPRLPFPFVGGSSDVLMSEYSARASEIEQDTLNLTISTAYEPSESTSFRADYYFIDTESLATTSNVIFNSRIGFNERPVAELDGDLRNAAEWTGFFNQSRNLTVDPSDSTTHSLSLKAETSRGKWAFDTVFGFSQREVSTDDRFIATFNHDNDSPDTSLFVPGIVDQLEGLVLSPHDPATAVPLFSQQGYAEYADPDRLSFSGGSFDVIEGQDTRLHFEGSVRIDDPMPYVKYLAAGVDIEETDLESFNDTRQITGASTLGAIGMPTEFNAFFGGGASAPFLIGSPSGSAVYRDFVFANSADEGIFAVSDFLGNPLNRETYTEEFNIDYYIEFSVGWQDFELVGGVRVATTDVEAAIASSASVIGPFFTPLTEVEERLRGISIRTAKQTDYLPRLLLNYRPNDNLVVRGGFYRTVSRPPLGFIGGLSDVSLFLVPIFGDGTQNFAFFLASNPDIEPATTDNFDAGVEYYFDNGGIVKANLFYKAIDNLQETLTIGNADVSDLSLPDDPIFDDLLENPENYATTVLVPQNNASISSVWGAELEYEQQFTALPGAFSGLGLFANFAYTDSEKDETLSFQGEEITVPDVKFDSQPAYSGAVGATYNYESFDASIGYTFQDRSFGGRSDFGLDQYASDFSTLDFRVEYFADLGVGQWRFFLEGTDILRGNDEPNLNDEFGGENNVPIIAAPGGRYFSGRTLRLGVLATF